MLNQALDYDRAMEYMSQNQETGNPIFGKVNEMAKKAAGMAMEAIKNIPEAVMSVVAININKENPQAVRSAFTYLQNEAGLVTNGVYDGMKNRLIAFRNSPKQ